jgi:hypothetical protein
VFCHQTQRVESLDAALELLPAPKEKNVTSEEIAENWGIEYQSVGIGGVRKVIENTMGWRFNSESSRHVESSQSDSCSAVMRRAFWIL